MVKFQAMDISRINVKLFLKKKYDISKALLTNSCTDALEMAAILLDVKAGDEIIMPAYTFVSTANAFILRGAKIVFCDSKPNHPGIDEDLIEGLINSRTKAIVPVHYAGIACNMEKIMHIANQYKLFVIEDAAHAIDSYFIYSNGERKALGSIGHLATFSFHETKNIISGEGGLLAINAPQFIERAEVIWEKGTNRSAFFRGEIERYDWIDIGSSFLPSEITAAFLFAQLENLDKIQTKRKAIWEKYFKILSQSELQLPNIPSYATNNAHLFFVCCKNTSQRTRLIEALGTKGILAVFHYTSLNKSPFYSQHYDGEDLPNSDFFTSNLLRLPFFYELSEEQQEEICEILMDNL